MILDAPGKGGGQRDGVKVEMLDPLREPSWDREALAHPDSTVFHSSAWATVLVKTYRHRAEYCRVTRSGTLAALVPLMGVRSRFSGSRGVCLPFTDFCDPLVFLPDAASELPDCLAGLARRRKWRYFEIRGKRISPPSATPSVKFYGHTVDLRATQDLFAALHPSVQRAIRKAERSGLEARILRTREAMLEFYRLHVQTRRRHGLPPQPLSFFLNIHEQILEQGLGFISLVRSGSAGIAAAVFFNQGTKGIYKFGASDRRFQAMRPNNLAMWHGMKFLSAGGTDVLHMGRTSLQNEGLRQFKLGWGAKEHTMVYFRLDSGTGTWSASSDRASGLHNAIFSKMPLFINRLMGTLIYPHLD